MILLNVHTLRLESYIFMSVERLSGSVEGSDGKQMTAEFLNCKRFQQMPHIVKNLVLPFLDKLITVALKLARAH